MFFLFCIGFAQLDQLAEFPWNQWNVSEGYFKPLKCFHSQAPQNYSGYCCAPDPSVIGSNHTVTLIFEFYLLSD